MYGGRRFADQKLFNETMDHAVANLFAKRYCIFEGGANGADRMAQLWAKLAGRAHATMPANWHYYDHAAGCIRNQDMLDFFNPDLAIEFPGGKGTKDMRDRLLKANVKIYQVQ